MLDPSMGARSRVLHLLLTAGVCDYTEAVDVSDINAQLRPLGYEAVVWPSRSHFVLRDRRESAEVAAPWKEGTVDEAKRVFAQIAERGRVQSPLLPLLEETGWVVRDEGDEPVLSMRALVQFEGFLAEIGGRYRRCQVCNFIVDTDDCHRHCRDVMARGK